MNQPRITYSEYVRLREGGDGSGNFDHKGRPGKVGGSSDEYIPELPSKPYGMEAKRASGRDSSAKAAGSAKPKTIEAPADNVPLKWDVLIANPVPTPLSLEMPKSVDGNPTDNIKLRKRQAYDGHGDDIGHRSAFANQWGTKPAPGVKHVVDSAEQVVDSYTQWLREQFKQKKTVYSDLMRYATDFLRGKQVNLILPDEAEASYGHAIKDAIVGVAKQIVNKRVPAAKFPAQKWIKNR